MVVISLHTLYTHWATVAVEANSAFWIMCFALRAWNLSADISVRYISGGFSFGVIVGEGLYTPISRDIKMINENKRSRSSGQDLSLSGTLPKPSQKMNLWDARHIFLAVWVGGVAAPGRALKNGWSAYIVVFPHVLVVCSALQHVPYASCDPGLRPTAGCFCGWWYQTPANRNAPSPLAYRQVRH